MFNETVLITGGTGSWGQELIKQLLRRNLKEIRIFSRNEASQVAMKSKFNNHKKLKFIIGDIRDKEEITNACEGAAYIYHLAALKHVPICEYQPSEALKTNVLGTMNVIQAAIYNGVKKVFYISTDKAANPFNFYGMTKSIGERLVINANLFSSGTRFACIRAGNVLGTNGSVVHVFKNQIKEKNEVGVTDKRMTRFFLTLKDAIGLLFKATSEAKGGEIFVMKMPACRIIDLAEVLIEASGEKNVRVRELGIRPGEKLHEILLSEFESDSTVHFDEEYFIILPTIHIPGLKKHYENFRKVKLQSYSSNGSFMTKKEIKQILMRGGFLS